MDAGFRRLPLLSEFSRRKKLDYFFADVPASAGILEIGCADRWLGYQLQTRGFANYVGLDLRPSADIVGDIREWSRLGLKPDSFDVVVAFEVVEHVDCYDEMYKLLRPGGQLFLTSPSPQWDWACKVLEVLKLSQPRTSPHDHLICFSCVPLFDRVELRTVGILAQWGKFRKPPRGTVQVRKALMEQIALEPAS